MSNDMELSLRVVELSSPDMPRLEQINIDGFPPNERDVLSDFYIELDGVDSEMLGIYEGDSLVGMMMTWRRGNTVYLANFAVALECRGRGLGERALRHYIEERYKGCEVFLCFEALDERADNIEQRERRRAFYLRSGFHETGWFAHFYDMEMELASTAVPCNVNNMRDLLDRASKQWPVYRGDWYVKP